MKMNNVNITCSREITIKISRMVESEAGKKRTAKEKLIKYGVFVHLQ